MCMNELPLYSNLIELLTTWNRGAKRLFNSLISKTFTDIPL